MTWRIEFQDFGAAEDDFQVGKLLAEEGEEFGDAGGVPDVDAEAEDVRVAGGDGVGNFGGGLLEGEFEELGLGAEVAHVGEEIARAEGGVAVPRVDGGEEDFICRHRTRFCGGGERAGS